MQESDYRRVVRACRVLKDVEERKDRITKVLKQLNKDEIITVFIRMGYFRDDHTVAACYEQLLNRNRRETDSILAELSALPEYAERTVRDNAKWKALHRMLERLSREFERLMDEAYPETKG